MSDHDGFLKLLKGKGVVRLGLPNLDGRTVITGIQIPKQETTGMIEVNGSHFFLGGGGVWFWLKHLKNLHFIGCDLTGLKFFGGGIRNCVFERCELQEMGFWNSKVRDTKFVDCDMRYSALGGIVDMWPVPNLFSDVKFVRCDLRDTAHSCELFSACLFDHCLLGQCDFEAARFEDCIFRGDLGDTMFRKRINGRYSKVPGNELLRCNFTDADVTWTTFLNLDLSPSAFANDPNLIFLNHGPKDFSDWLELGHIERNEGNTWWIGEKIKRSGTPTLVSRLSLNNFSSEAVDALERIGKHTS